MEPDEAREYLHIKYEIAKELPSEERRSFFMQEEATTQEARSAFVKDAMAKSLGEVSVLSKINEIDGRSAETKSSTERLPPFELGLTTFDEAQAVVWGHDTFNSFRENSKGLERRNKVKKDREFVYAQLSPKFDGQSVLQHPKFFITALDTWQAQALGGNVRAQELVDTVIENARAYMKVRWKEFDHKSIAEYIRASAGDRLSAGSATHLLRSYFEGPPTTKDKASAFHTLAGSILDLTNDYSALKHATSIGSFETDIIPHGSDFHLELLASQITAIDDLDLLRKVQIAWQTVQVARIVTGQPAENTEAIINIGSNPRFVAKMERMVKKIIAKGDPLLIERLFELIHMNNEHPTGTMDVIYVDDPVDPAEFRPQWMIDLYRMDSEDPVASRLNASLAPRARSNMFAQTLAEAEDGYKVTRVEHVALPSGIFIDIYVPSGLLPAQERVYTEQIIGLAKSELPEIEDDIRKIYRDNEMGMVLRHLDVSGHKIIYSYRVGGEFDDLTAHRLNELLWIGLPYAEQQTDNELIQALVEVQDNMEMYQHRFLNKRGVRIKFESDTMLGLRGYAQIIFKEDTHRPQNALVELMNRGKKYHYALDGNFNLVLDGRSISSLRHRNQIHYTSLLLLRDYICGIVLETEEGELESSAAGPAARIDHLRYLPEGQTFRPYASQNFLERRKKDLLTKSEERKRVDPRGRNSTYVKEIVQNDPTLPPLLVFVNPDDFLYHKIIANGFKLPPDLEH